MTASRRWVSTADLGLLTDRYEFSMVQAYWACGMQRDASFSLYFRELPETRRFMLACGQQHAARLVTEIGFTSEALDLLAGLGGFRDEFLRWLGDFRFSGDIVALPEGTPVFPQEPLLEVTAPVAEAQLLETLIMNLVHLETVLASKGARMVVAAQGRPVVDFGMRRMHGIDAAVHSVRAFKTAGIAATSNVLAGPHFGLPVTGTMAHSFVQAHEDEAAAFKAFAELYPGTTLLVDTYDTLTAIDRIVALKRNNDEFEIAAIRLDSGDLGELARAARQRLDAAGLEHVQIYASGGLNEHRIASLLASGAPIDAFGVGTELGTSADAPFLDLVYKLTSYDGSPRLKDSPGKQIYPGLKQVYRYRDEDGRSLYDEVTLREERRDADALLQPVVSNGELVQEAAPATDAAAERARTEIAALPAGVLALDGDGEDYEVRISAGVRQLRDEARARLGER